MVEPAVKSSEWSTWAALRAVGGLMLVGAILAGWFWATADVDTTGRDDAVLDTISATASLALFALGIPAGYLWIRGRRRAEDEADRAGRAIRDAQDEYDDRPRPIMKMLLFILLATWQLPTFAAPLLALIEDGLWLKAAVAGVVTTFVVLIAATMLGRIVTASFVATRRVLASRER